MNAILLEKREKKSCNHSIKITKTAERKVMLICKQTGRKFNDVINELLEQSEFRAVEPKNHAIKRFFSALFGKKQAQKRFSDASQRQKRPENPPSSPANEPEN